MFQWIRRDDKRTLPASLAYRDKGGMYLPEDNFLPLSVDECMCANEEGFWHYGKNLVKVVTEQVQHNQQLLQQFRTII